MSWQQLADASARDADKIKAETKQNESRNKTGLRAEQS
jgi:hypothetical protein